MYVYIYIYYNIHDRYIIYDIYTILYIYNLPYMILGKTSAFSDAALLRRASWLATPSPAWRTFPSRMRPGDGPFPSQEFVQHHPELMIFGDFWWLLMMFDDVWRSLMLFDDLKNICLMIVDDLWWFVDGETNGFVGSILGNLHMLDLSYGDWDLTYQPLSGISQEVGFDQHTYWDLRNGFDHQTSKKRIYPLVMTNISMENGP